MSTDSEPLHGAVVFRDTVSLPSDDGPDDTANRLYVLRVGDGYYMSIAPPIRTGDVPAGVPRFRVSTYGPRNKIVTMLVAALYARARGDIEGAIYALWSVRRECRGIAAGVQYPLRGVSVSGFLVSFPSDHAPDKSALHILGRMDYFAGVAPPALGAPIPALDPCFRACTSGAANPFVTSIFGALYHAAMGSYDHAADIVDVEWRALWGLR